MQLVANISKMPRILEFFKWDPMLHAVNYMPAKQLYLANHIGKKINITASLISHECKSYVQIMSVYFKTEIATHLGDQCQ